MNRLEKIKRIIFIVLAALASGYLMYSGFSLLMTEQQPTAPAQGAIEGSE